VNKLISELYLEQVISQVTDKYVVINGLRNNPNSISLYSMVNFMFYKGWQFAAYNYNGDYIEIIFKDMHKSTTKMC
jgi:hypothetical protein